MRTGPWNPRLVYATSPATAKRSDAALPGFDLTAFWARTGLLSMTRDAGAPPTWPVAGSGDNATAVSLYSQLRRHSNRRERTGQRILCQTSLLASGIGRRVCLSRLPSPGRRSTGCMIAPILKCRVNVYRCRIAPGSFGRHTRQDTRRPEAMARKIFLPIRDFRIPPG